MTERKPVVAIVGAGFGGLEAAKQLWNAPVDVILISRRNYHLFQPLLYQVATAGLSPGEIAHPVRAILRGQKNLEFRLSEMEAVDFEKRKLHTSTGVVGYDYLILAMGGQTTFFGDDSAARNGFDLKALDDAVDLRNHILTMFELAEQQEDEQLRRAMLTFVIVGGGPTGVESAGALSELIRLVLLKDYPNLDSSQVRVILLEMLDRVLGGFPDDLQEAAEQKLREKHVDVQLNALVTEYDGEQVHLKQQPAIRTRTLIWCAGVQAVSQVEKLGVELAKMNRVIVEPSLQLPDQPEAFVIGDAAYMEDEQGEPLPMMAPVAMQQGRQAADNILRLMNGEQPQPFKYADPGSLATIGRNAAVARVKQFKFSGFLAWVVWLAVHLFWLIGFRNRLLVLINWMWDYFLYERGVRVITRNGRQRLGSS
jgi:NADH dehydrogenase